MNTLSIDAETAAGPLAECEDGAEETMTVTGTYRKNPDGTARLEVTDIQKDYEEGEEKGMGMEHMGGPPEEMAPAIAALTSQA